jgi:hypothetical protein
MDIKNEKYYLLDNAIVYKSKKFNDYLNENKIKMFIMHFIILKQIQLKIYF